MYTDVRVNQCTQVVPNSDLHFSLFVIFTHLIDKTFVITSLVMQFCEYDFALLFAYLYFYTLHR